MRIGIISAMQEELEIIINELENKECIKVCDIEFYLGKFNNTDVVATICGVGKVNAATTTAIMINSFHPDLILNSGIAGGTEGLTSGSVVIADKLAYSDFDTTAFGYEFGQVPGMPLYFYPDENYKKLLENKFKENNIDFVNTTVLTADVFRLSAKEIKNNLMLGYAVEMEGGAIAQVCFKLKVPFLSIRVISDILDTESHISDYNSFEKEASHLSSKMTISFVKSL
jgi:adenosylhomocysteine nucleosidase